MTKKRYSLFLIITLQILTISFIITSSLSFDYLSEQTYPPGFDQDKCETEEPLEPTEQMFYGPPYEPNSTIKVNSSSSEYEENLPYYVADINSEGFRDNEFSPHSSEDSLRIIVVGDSFTFGKGLNASDRYTNVLEKKMNNSLSQDIVVLNLGISGNGIKDHYNFIQAKALDYEPDFIVVSFQKHDQLSGEQAGDIVTRVKKQHDIESYEELIDNSKAWKEVEQNHNQFYNNLDWTSSDIFVYGNRLHELSTKKDFELVLFDIELKYALYQDQIKNWESKCHVNILSAADYIAEPYERLYFSENPRFNVKGNQKLGEILSTELNSRII